MTEGIIQKVFKKYKSFKFKECDAMLEFANQIQLDSLEKELIEEIIMLNVFQNNPMLMKLLIGDSK